MPLLEADLVEAHMWITRPGLIFLSSFNGFSTIRATVSAEIPNHSMPSGKSNFTLTSV